MFAQLRSARRALFLPLVAVSFSIASCQSQTSQSPTGTENGGSSASPVAAGGNNGANVSPLLVLVLVFLLPYINVGFRSITSNIPMFELAINQLVVVLE